MKRIERPDWFNFNTFGNRHAINNWFTNNIEPLNKMIDGAVRVYGPIQSNHPNGLEGFYMPEGRQAYLIGIEPIVKQTREEKLEHALKDIIDMQCLEGPIIDNAKALLKEEK